ncbi:MAG: esterase family protein [Gammaproteobacteria bacterium]|nr:esterase family protein [Gammaproteobacteria bacterium]
MTNDMTRRRVLAALAAVGVPMAAMEVEDYLRLGLDKSFLGRGMAAQVNGRSNMELLEALNVPEDRQYHPCPEAHPGPDVPRGTVREFPGWDDTRVYAGTVRDVWVYTPVLDPSTAPSLMVFQDGQMYLDPTGPVRATAVLDSLIHAGELPPTVAVFVMPGRRPGMTDHEAMLNRSFEYDSVTPAYVRFLIDDLLPFAESEVGAQFARDPSMRLICGISSGGICAFNAAWHEPSAFGRVLSHVGSFVNIRGGHNYPYLIRSTPRKPIRVFLQGGKRDGNVIMGNWALANQVMASALEYAGYEYRFVFGEGGHSARHGGAIFADSLRWLMG